jgi:hypothetical protein
MTTQTKPRRIRRVVKLDDHVDYNDDTMTEHPIKAGDIVCLVRVTDTMTGRESNWLTREPRTNQSHELRWRGWLGTTNDVAEHAQGAWRVVSLVEHDSNYYREPWDLRYHASLVATEVPE